MSTRNCRRLSGDGLVFDLFKVIGSCVIHANHRKERALCRQHFSWIVSAQHPRGTKESVTCKKCLTILNSPD